MGYLKTTSNLNADRIKFGTVDGDRLPDVSATKKGAVPATGTPSGKYLKDDGTWATVSGGAGTPSSTVVTETDHGQTQNAGTAEAYSRGDHTHGTPVNPVTGHESTYNHGNFNTAYSHSQASHAPSDAQKNSDITKGEIEAKLTGEISSHSHAGGGGGLSQAQVLTRML